MNKTILIYDGSFEGFLTAVYNSYEEKMDLINIMTEEDVQSDLFASRELVITDAAKAEKLLAAIKRRQSPAAAGKIYRAFLSENKGIELELYKMLKYILKAPKGAASDYSQDSVLKIAQAAKMVGREKHRMEAFIRFRLTKDDIYFANIEPDFNVLPLIRTHFKNRYADQQWLIYDIKRKFGLFYDLERAYYISMNLPPELGISGAEQEFFDASENEVQKLWQEYFSSTFIKNRVNTRLHEQHVPKRYWKYLIEKTCIV